MDTSWMRDPNGELMDVHKDLLTYEQALSLFRTIETEGSVKEYCNGANAGGRWVFQIFNKEFIAEIAEIVRFALVSILNKGPVLEVMAGDGRLTEFLTPLVNREVIATDSRDGRYNIAYPKWVQKMDAHDSIDYYRPSIVVISWEPFLSEAGLGVVRSRVPTLWIGNPDRCGHPDLFKRKHIKKESRHTLCRHDSFADGRFVSDIFLFNCRGKWFP